MIVALTGYGRSGKNTVGDLLAEHHGFTQLAFADGVREAALALDPIVYAPGAVRLSEVVSEYGWEGLKSNTFPSVRNEVRRLLQRIGTEAGWKLHGETLWTDRLFARVDQIESFMHRNVPAGQLVTGHYAITDLRFPHEADAVQERGGYVVRIVRPGVGPLNGHESETLIDSIRPDLIVQNDGSLDTLRGMVAAMIGQLGAREDCRQRLGTAGRL